jgi:3-oxoacyl-[acyl-carrier-protein] synthase II
MSGGMTGRPGQDLALEITGWSAASPAGIGGAALAACLREHAAGGRVTLGEHPAVLWPDDPLPSDVSHVDTGFDVAQYVPRKGTRAYDRLTALSVAVGMDSLRAARLELTDDTSPRVGTVLGTTVGSLKSTSDFTRDTMTQDKPYLVNPILFPNTILNGPAGQIAIRFGLRGVNTTVGGGPLAFINAVRYAAMTILRSYADTMVVGAVEELTPHRAWLAHNSKEPPAAEVGGAFVLQRPGLTGRPVAVVAGVSTGFEPEYPARGPWVALGRCVRAVVGEQGTAVIEVFTSEVDPDTAEYDAAVHALGYQPARRTVSGIFGSCGAATAAMSLAVALTEGGPGPVLMTAHDRSGAVGAMLVSITAGPC